MSSTSSYEVFKQAEARIKNKTGDIKDEVIVALWKQSVELMAKCKKLQKSLDEDAKSAAQSYHQDDIAQSRAAIAAGMKMPVVPNI